MKKRFLRTMLAGLLAVGMLASLVPAALAADEKVTVTVLQTSDLHGMVTNFDYASNSATKNSMAHAAAIIKAEREKDPGLVLIDSGDTLQANYIQEFRTEDPHPMVDAMNYLKYDLWVLGNHEFNFEFANLNKAIAAFKGTVLAGNVYKADKTRWKDAYKILDVKGVKVAVLGITAPHIPQWEASDPTHFDNMTFAEPIDEVGKALTELEGKADVIIGVIHYGPDGEYGSAGGNEIAEKYAGKLDALFLGHAHASLGGEKKGGIPILEPGSNGSAVSKLALSLSKKDGKWIVDKEATKAELIKTADITPDPEFLAKYKPLHEKALAMAAKEVGTVGATFMDPVEVLPGIPAAVLGDNPLIDLVNKIQMEKTGADVSMAALFDANSNLVKGPFLHRNSVNVYKYDNTLFAVKVTGKQLKAVMEEYGGKFFNTYQPGDVTISFNPSIRLYNFDMFSGVNYEINISKPAGERIQNVTFKGAPLKDDQVLTLALNNYRYGGLVKAKLINAEDVVYDKGEAVRDMVGEYVANLGKPLMPEVDNNWKIVGADLNDPQKGLIYEMVKKGELKIPASEDGRTPNVASLNAIALRAAGKLPALPGEVKPEPKPEPKPEVPAGTYVVVKGDSLWRIAQKHLGAGVKWTVIYELNKAAIKNPNNIYVGQQLQLPAA